MDIRKAVKASEEFLKSSTVTGRNVQWEQTEHRCGWWDVGMNRKGRDCVRELTGELLSSGEITTSCNIYIYKAKVM